MYRNRNALLFVGISLVSGFGSTAMSLAAGLWVLDLTGSPSLAALCGLCVFAPTLAGPVLGALVDRLPRKALLIGTNVSLAAVLMTLFIVHSREQLWLVYAVSVAYGTSYVLLDAGESALLPSVLPDELLAQVNGVRMSAQEGTKLLAPLAGAGLYAVAGARAVVVLTAACLLVSAALYVGVRATATSDRPRPSKAVIPARTAGIAPTKSSHRVVGGTISSGLRDAWRYLWANHRSPVLLAAAALFVSGFSDAAGYAVVVDQMNLPTAFMGVMSAAQGAGAILGGFATGRVPNLGPTGAAVFAVGVAMKSVPWLPVNLAGSVVIGVGLPWTVVAAYTALQRGTPHDLLGRVSATATTLIFGSVALANPLGAGALSALGFFPTRVIALLIIGYAVVMAASTRIPTLRAARRTTDL